MALGLAADGSSMAALRRSLPPSAQGRARSAASSWPRHHVKRAVQVSRTRLQLAENYGWRRDEAETAPVSLHAHSARATGLVGMSSRVNLSMSCARPTRAAGIDPCGRHHVAKRHGFNESQVHASSPHQRIMSDFLLVDTLQAPPR